jgi:hypothetical protein
MTPYTTGRGRAYHDVGNISFSRIPQVEYEERRTWSWTPPRCSTRAHGCTRTTYAPHAATAPSRRPVPLLALQTRQFIAHRTFELLLLPPLLFALRRPSTLFFLATPFLFSHAFLFLKLRFILCTKRVSKKGHRRKREQAHTASAPIHRSSNISRVTCSDLDKMLTYLLSSASVCSSFSARRLR